MKLCAVSPRDPKLALEYWPLAEDHIFAAMDKIGLQSGQWVKEMVFRGQALLWLAVKEADPACFPQSKPEVVGAVVTRLIEHGAVCEIVACGGKADGDFSEVEKIEKHAREEKCHAIRIYGRPGWPKALKEYRPKAVILEKVL